MTQAIDYIDPVELTLFSRNVLAEFDQRVQSLARFLPYREVGDIRYAYSKGVDALIDEATFRAFDAESPIARRPGAARVTGELLPISRKIPLAEYDALRLRRAGNDEIANAVYDDAARLARGVAARLEQARGQLLATGKVTIAENGLVTEYDAGRDVALTPPALTTTARWSDLDDSDPIANVIAWCDLVESISGIRPNRLVISTTVLAYLQQNEQIRGWNIAPALAPQRVASNVVIDAFQALAGVTLEVYQPPAGITRPISANVVVLLADGVPLGFTAHGVTLESAEPTFGNRMQPGLVAGAWLENVDPVQLWTKAVTIALPLLAAPDATFAIDVLNP